MPQTIQLGGVLNFGGVPDFSAGGGFGQSYADMVRASSQAYQNVLAGYQGTLSAQQANQQEVQSGYADLERRVLETIRGQEGAQRRQLSDLYQQELARAQQGLVSSGLGNTTVSSSVLGGVGDAYAKRGEDLAASMADKLASAQSQIGGAGLNYRGQAIRDNSALAGSQLGFMASYPGQVFGQLGQLQSAAASYGLEQQRLAQAKDQFAQQLAQQGYQFNATHGYDVVHNPGMPGVPGAGGAPTGYLTYRPRS